MAQRQVARSGKVEQVEFDAAELAIALGITPEQLAQWARAIPVASDGVYRYAAAEDFRRIRHRSAVLKTGMNLDQLHAVEDEGMLGTYASLSRDCPAGITAHVWRSYATVVLMQVRHKTMIDADELAVRARLVEIDPLSGERVPSVTMARRHLSLLQAVGVLKNSGMQWQHQGLPLCMRGKADA